MFPTDVKDMFCAHFMRGFAKASPLATPEDAVRVMSAKSSFMSVLVAFASLTSRAGLSRDANRITHAALPQSFEDFFSQAAKRLEDGWPIISVGQAFKAVR